MYYNTTPILPFLIILILSLFSSNAHSYVHQPNDHRKRLPSRLRRRVPGRRHPRPPQTQTKIQNLRPRHSPLTTLRQARDRSTAEFHITDAQKPRWEVPYTLLPREQPPVIKHTLNKKVNVDQTTTLSEYSSSELVFSYNADPFGFALRRKSDDQVLFNTTSTKPDPFREMVFKYQYLEISTTLPKDASLYGLGENSQPHGIKLYPNDPYTLYTTDASAINLNTDLYGSHRFIWT